jgi:hypothetical protein
MTLDEWLQRIPPPDRPDVIKRANDQSITYLICRREGDTGWAIDHDGVWMWASECKQELIDFCEQMGWSYEVLHDD